MSTKFVVMHLGHPVSCYSTVDNDEWKSYSHHTSLRAAMRAVTKATEHLGPNEWNDHYIIIAPDGHRVTEVEELEENSRIFVKSLR